jgi:hypothetical protein
MNNLFYGGTGETSMNHFKGNKSNASLSSIEDVNPVDLVYQEGNSSLSKLAQKPEPEDKGQMFLVNIGNNTTQPTTMIHSQFNTNSGLTDNSNVFRPISNLINTSTFVDHSSSFHPVEQEQKPCEEHETSDENEL